MQSAECRVQNAECRVQSAELWLKTSFVGFLQEVKLKNIYSVNEIFN